MSKRINIFGSKPKWEPEVVKLLGVTLSVAKDNTLYMPSTAYEIAGIDLWNYYNTLIENTKDIFGLQRKVMSLNQRMKFWYPRLLDSATAHKYNAVDPTTFVGTYNGGFTHDGSGDDPNGSNAYFDTDCVFNTFSQNDMSFFVLIKENNNGTYADYGCVAGGAGELLLYPRIASTNLRSRLSSSADVTDTHSSSLGFIGHTRNSSTEFKTFVDGSVLETNTDTSFAPNGLKIKEYATSLSNDSTHIFYTPNRHTHFMGLDGVTDTEAQDIYNAIANLETALNR